MKIFKTAVSSFMLMLAIALPCETKAQESTGKPNVFIDYFWRPSEIPFTCAEQLRSYVIEGISNTKRIELIDVDSSDALAIEASRREAGVD
ncbi:MAG: hypothetical protein K2F76_04345, partial [Duncaniella dubosii]|nr:hypothetical protein [Duncaniella dubosii]